MKNLFSFDNSKKKSEKKEYFPTNRLFINHIYSSLNEKIEKEDTFFKDTENKIIKINKKKEKKHFKINVTKNNESLKKSRKSSSEMEDNLEVVSEKRKRNLEFSEFLSDRKIEYLLNENEFRNINPATKDSFLLTKKKNFEKNKNEKKIPNNIFLEEYKTRSSREEDIPNPFKVNLEILSISDKKTPSLKNSESDWKKTEKSKKSEEKNRGIEKAKLNLKKYNKMSENYGKYVLSINPRYHGVPLKPIEKSISPEIRKRSVSIEDKSHRLNKISYNIKKYAFQKNPFFKNEILYDDLRRDNKYEGNKKSISPELNYFSSNLKRNLEENNNYPISSQPSQNNNIVRNNYQKKVYLNNDHSPKNLERLSNEKHFIRKYLVGSNSTQRFFYEGKNENGEIFYNKKYSSFNQEIPNVQNNVEILNKDKGNFVLEQELETIYENKCKNLNVLKNDIKNIEYEKESLQKEIWKLREVLNKIK